MMYTVSGAYVCISMLATIYMQFSILLAKNGHQIQVERGLHEPYICWSGCTARHISRLQPVKLLGAFLLGAFLLLHSWVWIIWPQHTVAISYSAFLLFSFIIGRSSLTVFRMASTGPAATHLYSFISLSVLVKLSFVVLKTILITPC